MKERRSKLEQGTELQRRRAVLLQCGNMFAVAAAMGSMAHQARSGHPIDAATLANRLAGLAQIGQE